MSKKIPPEAILDNPLLNKGMAFSEKERDALGLQGLLPYGVSSIEDQVKRRYANFKQQPDDISKFVFLSALQNRNEILFYRLVFEHLQEMVPLIYTPTVGVVSTDYSSLYREHRGLYLSYPLKDKIDAIIQNYSRSEIDVIVVTDGERILGLGDLGVGGMAIPVGKLALYTLFGGIHPARTLPVLLDVGTNNKQMLEDPLYIGWQHPRITGREYDDFVDRFVQAIKKRYPHILLQWEDFAKSHSYTLLNRYRTQLCSFNDDIQGTAAVVLAAVLSAVQLSRQSLKEQRIALLGGGSAGIGICEKIVKAIISETDLTEKEARALFYVVDKQGLIHTQIKEADENQKRFAQDFAKIKQWKVKNPSHISLLDVIENGHPTILIGVSTVGGAFTEEIVTKMAKYTKRPVIFPLSNPTSLSEAHPADLIQWTKGEAIIAT
ncbi:MAG TPA: NAD-dependent malic enzyme, partial [Rhabdochlamydiaceae bacterium]|nr:NAD-dependent malic enzyme [Rhabdochlamydiaceae bacterium]